MYNIHVNIFHYTVVFDLKSLNFFFNTLSMMWPPVEWGDNSRRVRNFFENLICGNVLGLTCHNRNVTQSAYERTSHASISFWSHFVLTSLFGLETSLRRNPGCGSIQLVLCRVNDILNSLVILYSIRSHGMNCCRSVGGLRASLYNAITVDDVRQLVTFMLDFQLNNSNWHGSSFSANNTSVISYRLWSFNISVSSVSLCGSMSTCFLRRRSDGAQHQMNCAQNSLQRLQVVTNIIYYYY